LILNGSQQRLAKVLLKSAERKHGNDDVWICLVCEMGYTLSCGHFNKHIAAYIIKMMIDD